MGSPDSITFEVSGFFNDSRICMWDVFRNHYIIQHFRVWLHGSFFLLPSWLYSVYFHFNQLSGSVWLGIKNSENIRGFLQIDPLWYKHKEMVWFLWILFIKINCIISCILNFLLFRGLDGFEPSNISRLDHIRGLRVFQRFLDGAISVRDCSVCTWDVFLLRKPPIWSTE